MQVRDIEHGTIPHNKQPKEVLKVKTSSYQRYHYHHYCHGHHSHHGHRHHHHHHDKEQTIGRMLARGSKVGLWAPSISPESLLKLSSKFHHRHHHQLTNEPYRHHQAVHSN